MMQSGLGGAKPRSLFFALIPDASIIAQIETAIASIAKSSAAFGRKIKPHRQHMTVFYIDAFDAFPEMAVRSAEAAADLVHVDAFGMTLDKAGSFPGGDVPWWLGSENVPANLLELRKKLVDGLHLARQKFRGETSFVPHVTISRKNSDFLPPAAIAPIHWQVREFCLIESVLNEPEYNVLKKWKLANG